jgi:MSHA pilin protein MshA
MKQQVTLPKGKGGQQGFTLIELVVVIVLLGILAASALPKFIDITADARVSSLQGLSGSVRSAAAMAHAKAIVSKQNGASGTITVEGESIDLVNGYPSKSAVALLLQDTSGYNFVEGTDTVTIDNAAANTVTCNVVYQEAQANQAPVITLTTTDCN